VKQSGNFLDKTSQNTFSEQLYCISQASTNLVHCDRHISLFFKGKVIPLLLLTEHNTMEAYWSSGGIAPRILDLGTRWRWVVSFTPRSIYAQRKNPGSHWIGGWVGPRAGLDAVLLPGLESPIIHPVAQHYTTELPRLLLCSLKLSFLSVPVMVSEICDNHMAYSQQIMICIINRVYVRLINPEIANMHCL
jgi:hypothetical protein